MILVRGTYWMWYILMYFDTDTDFCNLLLFSLVASADLLKVHSFSIFMVKEWAKEACLLPAYWIHCLSYSSILYTEVVHSSDRYTSTGLHDMTSKITVLFGHCCKNLKSYIQMLFLVPQVSIFLFPKITGTNWSL
jgi:hypothetical protein